jgi:uncharacterized protein DUF6515
MQDNVLKSCSLRTLSAAALPVGAMVPSLPPGCASMVIGEVNYFQCGGVFYRAGFQGNSVVYIVSAP